MGLAGLESLGVGGSGSARNTLTYINVKKKHSKKTLIDLCFAAIKQTSGICQEMRIAKIICLNCFFELFILISRLNKV